LRVRGMINDCVYGRIFVYEKWMLMICCEVGLKNFFVSYGMSFQPTIHHYFIYNQGCFQILEKDSLWSLREWKELWIDFIMKGMFIIWMWRLILIDFVHVIIINISF
jgi:hypothetical protein